MEEAGFESLVMPRPGVVLPTTAPYPTDRYVFTCGASVSALCVPKSFHISHLLWTSEWWDRVGFMLVFQKQSLVQGHRFEPPTIMCWEGMVIPGENTQNSLSLKNIHQEKKKKNIQSKQKTIVEICKQKEHLAVSLYLYLTTCQISDLLSYIPERPREMMHCVHLVPPFPLADHQAQSGISSCAGFWYQGDPVALLPCILGVHAIPQPSFTQWGLLKIEKMRWN